MIQKLTTLDKNMMFKKMNELIEYLNNRDIVKISDAEGLRNASRVEDWQFDLEIRYDSPSIYMVLENKKALSDAEIEKHGYKIDFITDMVNVNKGK